MMQLSQRVLALTAPLWMTREQFVLGGNEQALFQLDQWQKQSLQNVCFITGEKGSGRSHLAQASLRDASVSGNTVAYIAAQDVLKLSSDIFQGLEQIRFVCIDDVDTLIDDRDFLYALKEFLTRHRDVGGFCLMTCINSTSVLSALETVSLNYVCINIYPLTTNDQRRDALLMRAEAMDLELPASVVAELMHHFGHDISELMHVLSYVSHASMTLKRAITLPFVRKVLMLSARGRVKERK